MSSERKYCSKCGERILQFDAEFCPKCGKKLDSSQNNETRQDTSDNESFSTESSSSNNSSKNKGSKFVVDMILVIVLLGLIFFVLTIGLGFNLGGTEQPESIIQSPIIQAIVPTEIFIQSLEVVDNDRINVKVEIGGDFHHWNIDIKRLSESGSAGGIIVNKPYLSHILSDLKPGTYTVCVGAADSENRLLGKQDCKSGIVLKSTEISIIDAGIRGNDLLINVEIIGSYDHWHVGIADSENRYVNTLAKSGSAGGIIVSGKNVYSYELSDLKPGTYTVCVGAADSENRLLGPTDCKSGIVVELFDLEWELFSSDLDVGFPNAWYKISFTIFNPNLVPVTISDSKIGMYVNGEFIGNSESRVVETISANGETVVTIKFEISYAKLIQLGIEAGDELIHVEGTARFNSMDGNELKYQVFCLQDCQ